MCCCGILGTFYGLVTIESITYNLKVYFVMAQAAFWGPIYYFLVFFFVMNCPSARGFLFHIWEFCFSYSGIMRFWESTASWNLGWYWAFSRNWIELAGGQSSGLKAVYMHGVFVCERKWFADLVLDLPELEAWSSTSLQGSGKIRSQNVSLLSMV